MGRSAFRGLATGVLVILFPSVMFAADSNAAILYTKGATWINGAHVPRSSSAVFSGDLVQTRSDTVANLNQTGSSVTVLADSLIQFQGTSLKIEHGGVAVSTSNGMAASAGEVKIAPASGAWTEFNVIDVDGTVRIAARKGDLTVSDGKETVTLAQGQETTREESSGPNRKKKKEQQSGAPVAAKGAIMNSPWALGIGGGAIIGVATWVLMKNDDPASPAKPN